MTSREVEEDAKMSEDPRAEAKELLKRHLKHTHGYYLGVDKTPDEEIGKIVDLIVEAALKEAKAEVEYALTNVRFKP